MRIITFFLIFIVTINFSFGKEKIKTRRITNNYTTFCESYKVLKEDRNIKHGIYKKRRHVSNDIIEIGEFDYGKKTGIWEYYNDTSGELKLEQKYDFNKDTIIFNQNEEVDQFEIYKNAQWINTKIETPPIHIGGKLNLYLKIIENIEIPEEAKMDKIEGPVIVTLTLNKNGETEDIELAMSLRNDCDKAIIEAIKKIKTDWEIPSINGEKYKIKYPLAFIYKYHEWTTSENKTHSIYFVNTPNNQ